MRQLPRPMLLSGFAIQAWALSIVFHGAALSAIWGFHGGGGSGGVAGGGAAGKDSLDISVGAVAAGEQPEDVPPDQAALIGPAQDEFAGAAVTQALSAPAVAAQIVEPRDEASQLVVDPPLRSSRDMWSNADEVPASADSSASQLADSKSTPGEPAMDRRQESTAAAAPGGVHSDPAFEANSIVYPESAKLAKLQGTVLLRVQISHDGHVHSVSVVKSSGVAILDDAATTAVKTWRGHPARRDGEAVDSAVLLPVIFRLR